VGLHDDANNWIVGGHRIAPWPYSYQWTASQMAPPSGSDYYYTASKDAGSFATSWSVKVVVTDAANGRGESEIIVYENASAPVCPI
jgi:hypothetical protein